MSQLSNVAEMVKQAHLRLFDQRDLSVLATHFAPNFIEHSPLVSNGIEGLKSLVLECPQLRYECVRVLHDTRNHLVALHGRFSGLDEHPLVGFDIYRVDGQKIVEHWDGLVPQAAPNASGRTQLDGSSQVTNRHLTEFNRELVHTFFTQTLIEGDYEGFRRYSDGHTFYQHSPDIADGVQPVIDFLNQLKAQGNGLKYSKIHRSVADGQFVLTHSEGSIAGQRHAYFELWRVEDNHVVELWDAITPVPQDHEAKHSFGIF